MAAAEKKTGTESMQLDQPKPSAKHSEVDMTTVEYDGSASKNEDEHAMFVTMRNSQNDRSEESRNGCDIARDGTGTTGYSRGSEVRHEGVPRTKFVEQKTPAHIAEMVENLECAWNIESFDMGQFEHQQKDR